MASETLVFFGQKFDKNRGGVVRFFRRHLKRVNSWAFHCSGKNISVPKTLSADKHGLKVMAVFSQLCEITMVGGNIGRRSTTAGGE